MKPKDRTHKDAPASNREKIPPYNEEHHDGSFQRVPGPGPRDEGKGAAGDEALNRVERKE